MKKNKRIEIYLFKFRNRNHRMDKKFYFLVIIVKTINYLINRRILKICKLRFNNLNLSKVNKFKILKGHIMEKNFEEIKDCYKAF